MVNIRYHYRDTSVTNDPAFVSSEKLLQGVTSKQTNKANHSVTYSMKPVVLSVLAYVVLLTVCVHESTGIPFAIDITPVDANTHSRVASGYKDHSEPLREQRVYTNEGKRQFDSKHLGFIYSIQ
ncbi:uncharacterized protein LOC144349225 [Saccoglossus kowalevskii]